MISNQPTDFMWLNRQFFPKQNHDLMKNLSKKCRTLGLQSWQVWLDARDCALFRVSFGLNAGGAGAGSGGYVRVLPSLVWPGAAGPGLPQPSFSIHTLTPAASPLAPVAQLFAAWPASQNQKAEADVPKSGASMLLWNLLPPELPTGFFSRVLRLNPCF